MLRPLPCVVEPVELPPDGRARGPASALPLNVFTQQGNAPIDGEIAQLVGRVRQSVVQDLHSLVRPERGAPLPPAVKQGGWLPGFGVEGQPVGDRFPADADQPRDLGNPPAVRNLEEGEGTAVDADGTRPLQLGLQEPALLAVQFETVHAALPANPPRVSVPLRRPPARVWGTTVRMNYAARRNKASATLEGPLTVVAGLGGRQLGRVPAGDVLASRCVQTAEPVLLVRVGPHDPTTVPDPHLAGVDPPTATPSAEDRARDLQLACQVP